MLFRHYVLSSSLVDRPHGLQHSRLPCPSLSPRICSDSCPLSWWCHPTISSSVTPTPTVLSLSLHQDLFEWVGSLHQIARVLELQLQSFQWIFSIDILQEWLIWSLCSPGDSQESSPVTQFKNISSLALDFLHGPTLTSLHNYRKNHSFDSPDLCWQNDVSAF